MKKTERSILIIGCFGILVMALTLGNCESKSQDQQDPGGSNQPLDFPEFITPSGKYFETRIAEIPNIDGDPYLLKISGAIQNPRSFKLEELRNLEMFERTLTIECIGNPANGDLLGTATWKGFRVYDLLNSLGIPEGAITVKYLCADGYFTYNSLEELQNAEVLGALYMNGDPIKPKYGFPLRIIFPGYYGVRQPGWIVEMELLESGIEDFWSQAGWKTDSSMAIDSKIFFPGDFTKFTLGDTVRIGGAAYGGKRISLVEITLDDGKTWIPVTTHMSLDQDHVWIFWEVKIIPQNTGTLTIQSRATAKDGSVQPKEDNEYLNGTNSWPTIRIQVAG